MYRAHSVSNDSRLRVFNNFLTVVVLCLGLYIFIMPFMPQIIFWIKGKTGQHSTSIAYTSNLNKDSKDADEKKPAPKDNRLVIPQMELDAVINEGRSAGTLRKGLWRRPKTSTPDKGSNTVIVAHRFTYKSPAIFYHLDKVKENDVFALFWNGKEYNYRVREVKVVEPTDIYVEDPTDDPILTLYTCTPLWTAKQRLVVISDLINKEVLDE